MGRHAGIEDARHPAERDSRRSGASGQRGGDHGLGPGRAASGPGVWRHGRRLPDERHRRRHDLRRGGRPADDGSPSGRQCPFLGAADDDLGRRRVDVRLGPLADDQCSWSDGARSRCPGNGVREPRRPVPSGRRAGHRSADPLSDRRAPRRGSRTACLSRSAARPSGRSVPRVVPGESPRAPRRLPSRRPRPRSSARRSPPDRTAASRRGGPRPSPRRRR